MTFEEWAVKDGYLSREQNNAEWYAAQAAWLASRNAALEEAAKMCQEHEPKDFTVAGIMTRAMCAEAILALKDRSQSENDRSQGENK